MNPSSSDRYARQRQFAPIGAQGQQRIEQAEVAVLGCGALGTVAAELLCRAGVGQIRIVDRDVVEWTNLQRQSLFDSEDARQGASKAEAACRRLRQINDQVKLTPIVTDVHAGNIESVLDGAQLVIDATDNFGIRFLLNDWALATGTAWVHGGCVGAAGQVRLFDGNDRPCFRCLIPQLPPAGAVDTCDTAGVIGPATHLIASLQSAEAIKWISGNRDAVSKSVFSIDLWNNRVRHVTLDPAIAPDCIACVGREFDFLRGDALQSSEGALCGRDAVQLNPQNDSVRIDLTEMARRWESIGAVQSTRFFTRLQIDDTTQLTLFRDGRVVVDGTDDVARARSLFDRFVGN
ncbi:Molybdopterin-synthase adenylyltransferase [Stieleria maiorica]|uniref:Molybdopterin-synthase adenylyltransferase n=1 Tax=Stieleria maiorica TaxID=2795974 RepID=A0A5B9MJ50_9BACT|nr:ThiF family adenylyltransferase [Stieleria maiorica]QEG00047.1 Molybdopterin-synthase adenylyltransferase [Stieleria maiorica]